MGKKQELEEWLEDEARRTGTTAKVKKRLEELRRDPKKVRIVRKSPLPRRH